MSSLKSDGDDNPQLLRGVRGVAYDSCDERIEEARRGRGGWGRTRDNEGTRAERLVCIVLQNWV